MLQLFKSGVQIKIGSFVMPLISDINSSSFSPSVEALRAQIVANGRGDITFDGETVSIVYDATDGRFSSSGDSGGLLSELLLLGFNSGPQALSERLISMITQSQESLQEKILNVSFLFVQIAFSVRLRLLNVQLHWSNQKKAYWSKILRIQQYAAYLMLMHLNV